MAEQAKNHEPIPGIGVGQGVAIGPAFVIEHGEVPVPEFCLAEQGVPDELARFETAVATSRDQVVKLKQKSNDAHGEASEELGMLLDAYIHMLENSRLIRGVARRIEQDRINAEWAIRVEVDDITRTFQDMADPYLASRLDDIREVGNRLKRNLVGMPDRVFDHAPEGAILVVEEMTPADTALLDPSKIAGFLTALGGAQGHTAIMARSLDLPAVLGAGPAVSQIQTGELLIVDAKSGQILRFATEWEQQRYARRRTEQENRRRALDVLRDLPGETRDGTPIGLSANVELPIEFDRLADWGGDGVGLLRSEFLFMNRATLPDEEEQTQILIDLLKKLAGRPATIRTLDIGGEKLACSLADEFGQSPNPSLGLRAVRLSLKKPDLLRTQFRAILRASAVGPVRVLIPMISRVEEMRKVRAIYQQVAHELVKENHTIAHPLPPLGAMIEIPAAALAADALAQICDFFAIGTNDLTQYTLAIDRADEQVAELYDPLHPAVLRLIQFTTRAGALAGIPVSICGEMAADPRFAPLLLGLGLRQLSMVPPAIPLVKQRVRTLSIDDVTRKAGLVMEQSDPTRIQMMLNDFSELA